MTTIISSLYRGYAFQATDRLVTLERTGEAWDRAANKSVVYIDGMTAVSISYAGVAYVGRTPTDRYIAELLTGLSLDEAAFMRSGGSRPRHVWELVSLLRDGLGSAVGTLPSSHSLELHVVGFQRLRRGSSRPCLWSLDRTGGDVDLDPDTQRIPRRSPKLMWFASFGGTVTEDLPNRTRHRIGAMGKGSPSGFEFALVECIREVAATRDTTGADCLTIRICPAGHPLPDGKKAHVVCRYFPQDAHANVDGNAAAYTPWVITPHWIYCPSLFTSTIASPWVTDDGIAILFSLANKTGATDGPVVGQRGIEQRPPP